MGRKRVLDRRYLITTSITEDAREFIGKYGGTLSKEPFYRRLDRFIADRRDGRCSNCARMSNIAEKYRQELRALEQRISTGQTVLY